MLVIADAPFLLRRARQSTLRRRRLTCAGSSVRDLAVGESFGYHICRHFLDADRFFGEGMLVCRVGSLKQARTFWRSYDEISSITFSDRRYRAYFSAGASGFGRARRARR